MRNQMQRLNRLIFATCVIALFGAFGCANGNSMEDDDPIGGGPIEEGEGIFENEFGVWDADDDGVISEDEFQAGIEKEGIWTDWDANQDKKLDEEEFTVSAENVGMTDLDFNAFDADDDGSVDGEEFQDGLFGAFDEDSSGFIETKEYQPGVI
jgi:Ca2+-binding EF-hand superfamily protein